MAKLKPNPTLDQYLELLPDRWKLVLKANRITSSADFLQREWHDLAKIVVPGMKKTEAKSHINNLRTIIVRAARKDGNTQLANLQPPPQPKNPPPTTTTATEGTKDIETRKRNRNRETETESKYTAVPNVELDSQPYPGYVDSKCNFYTTLGHESYISVAAKLGMEDPLDLAFVEDNATQYGTKRNTMFHRNTLLRIPTQFCSNWKLEKLQNREVDEIEGLGICEICHQQEEEEENEDKKEAVQRLGNDNDDTANSHNHNNPMLICDGCDANCHLFCAGLKRVPDGDWLCTDCVTILTARKKHHYEDTTDNVSAPSLKVALPPLPECPPEMQCRVASATTKLHSYLVQRADTSFRQLQQNHEAIATSRNERIEELQSRTIPHHNSIVERIREEFPIEARRLRDLHNIYGWGSVPNNNRTLNYILSKDPQTGRNTKYYNPHTSFAFESYYHRDGRDGQTSVEEWNRILPNWRRFLPQWKALSNRKKRAEKDLKTAKGNLVHCLNEKKTRCRDEKHELKQLTLFNSALWDAKILGICPVRDHRDVQVLNLLREPEELILIVPMKETTSNGVAAVMAHRTTTTTSFVDNNIPDIIVGNEYAIFGCTELLRSERDDLLPMDLSGYGSMRAAQKHLIGMLLNSNQSIVITRPSVPSSVHIRDEENVQRYAKCFDLSELVRDCNYPLNMPKSPTPKCLADNGLVLRDYQQASLQWMIDKEQNLSGMGFAGELWSRIQFLDGSDDYFYCELTGAIVKHIFDYKSDVEQTDVARNFGSFPTAGILGEEMGLGKTIISLSLICANPRPKHNQVLPREHIVSGKIDHPLYSPPPSVKGCTTSSAKNILLSNGTIVIVPMTLMSQWQSEVQRFAPWMSIITLHNDETSSVEQIASKDIVLVSTNLLQEADRLFNKLKRIHFHRAMLDESHSNQMGGKLKKSLAALSASHRFCITGTPVGRSLNDLQGQLRWLRVSQFCRSDFWNENIGKPYCERNLDSLRVLRSLLSRVIVRHSKDQTLEDGSAMISLPPRTVETILLPFGSSVEEKIYKTMEEQNTKRFLELRSESPQTVLSKYMELSGMIYSTRQACAHASLINLDSIQKLNVKTADEKANKRGALHGKPKSTTRNGILEQAIKYARGHAKFRMREAVLLFHNDPGSLMECPVCYEPTGECNIALTPCAHKFCSECIIAVLSSASSSREAVGKCPECREVIRRSELTFLSDAEDAGESKIPQKKQDEDKKPAAKTSLKTNVKGFELNTQEIVAETADSATKRKYYKPIDEQEMVKLQTRFHTLSPGFLADVEAASSCIGTKTSRFLDEIKKMKEQDPKSKCVVFTLYEDLLDLLAGELYCRKIDFVHIDGNMKQHQRADALERFSNNPDTKVFLLSMRAGATGLNLISADHCFILDPPLNTAIEEQAIDRIHRIGQTRPVTVKRFIMKGTIEERVLSNRRSLAADRGPNTSTEIDGVGLIADEMLLQQQPKKRRLGEDAEKENSFNASSTQRLKFLEQLFGYSSTVRVFKS